MTRILRDACRMTKLPPITLIAKAIEKDPLVEKDEEWKEAHWLFRAMEDNGLKQPEWLTDWLIDLLTGRLVLPKSAQKVSIH